MVDSNNTGVVSSDPEAALLVFEDIANPVSVNR
jgi:hypothetical protein